MYGRNKRQWCVMLFTICLLLVSAVPIAAETGDIIRAPVNDYADVIPDPVETYVGEKLRDHFEKTGVQMAVLVISTTSGEPIEDVSLKVAKQWGGGSAGEDRGVLLTLAIDDRRSRLEVGYGLEALLTDAWAARLLADMQPELREYDYQAAVRYAVNQVMARTESLRPGDTPGLLAGNPLWNVVVGGWIVLLLGWLLSMGFFLLARREVEPFSGDAGVGWALGAHSLVAAVVVLGTMGIAPEGYLFVYVAGAVCGAIVMTVKSWKRFAPVVGALAVLALTIYKPDVLTLGNDDPEWQLIYFAGWLLAGGLLPWTRVRVAGRTFGAGGSGTTSGSSFSSGGGYSGGGGSFGGGGASGGW